MTMMVKFICDYCLSEITVFDKDVPYHYNDGDLCDFCREGHYHEVERFSYTKGDTENE